MDVGVVICHEGWVDDRRIVVHDGSVYVAARIWLAAVCMSSTLMQKYNVVLTGHGDCYCHFNIHKLEFLVTDSFFSAIIRLRELIMVNWRVEGNITAARKSRRACGTTNL